MKQLLITLLITGISQIAFTQNTDYQNLVSSATKLYESRDYQKSTEVFEKAFQIKQSEKTDLYNGACSAALSNNVDLAFQWLKLSIENGYDNPDHLSTDPDLVSLRCDSKWNDFQQQAKKNKKASEEALDQAFKNVKQAIKEGNVDKFWQMANETFKSKNSKEKLSKELNDIRKVIEFNKIANLKEVRVRQSVNNLYVNGKVSKTWHNEYKVFPNLFGEETKIWIARGAGKTSFEFKLQQEGDSYSIVDFSYKPAFIQTEKKLEDQLNEFLNDDQAYSSTVVIRVKEKFLKLSGFNDVNKDDLINIFGNPQKVESKIPENELITNEVYGLSVSRVVTRDNPNPGIDDFFNSTKINVISTCQILFSLKNQYVIFITEEGYEVYNNIDRKQLKAFLQQHIQNQLL
ncbi:MAG: hypothetical protein AAFQ94_04900 [Bacteroidota bacterium]